MSLALGTRLGLYDILGLLGAGGMGEVYRARDVRLDRDVALKVLGADVARDSVRLERFAREARAIAALNHPNIVTVYSTEEADGIQFLTMELVEGQTLDRRIPTDGLPLARFLDVALPLADALTAAHQKQITHRDLKPGNVMVTADGRVKVLDFGLAKVGQADHGERSLAATRTALTGHGIIVGTMPYMSPEQVEGKDVDHRSDLFSLGVMFYEMLAGVRPFDGPSSPALMSSILRDTPPDVGERRADVPGEIGRLVARLIEKRPEDRVQTARDVFNELRHVQKQLDSGAAKRPSSGTIENLTLAVVPFTARGGDAAALALAEALTDDVTNGLSKFGNLRVQARETAGRARYVLEGQVRRAGATLRVSVRLIDRQAGSNLWAEHVDRDAATDAFALQDEIASRIVATVGDPTGVLARSIASAAAGVPYNELGVLELVARYHAYTESFRPEEHARLRAGFEAAVEREPRNAEAWACLALLYEHEHSHRLNPTPRPLQRQRVAAERAVELDARSPHAWVAMVSTHQFARDLPALRHAVERVVSLNPLDADNVALAALHLSAAGDYSRAVPLVRGAIAHKPQHPGWYYFPIFDSLVTAGDYEAALREIKSVNMPMLWFAQAGAAAVAGHLGRVHEARSALEAVRVINPALLDPELARQTWAIWGWNESLTDTLVDGYRKALALTSSDSSMTEATSTSQTPPSNDVRSPSGSSERPRSGSTSSESDTARPGSVSVAVLPLVSRSADQDTTALAEGLTDDITSGLSRFGYLHVLSRALAERLAREQTDVNAHARYAIDGNVRRAGQAIRTSVTLVDTHTGSNVWTSTYDRDLGVGAFAIQDDVSSAVVATLGDQTGVLMRAMAAGIADRPLDQLTAAELVVQCHLYTEHFNPVAHARLRDALERALEREPRAAEGWACLSLLYEHEHGFRFNTRPDALVRQRRAAEKAQELDPRSQQAWIAMASVHVFARDREALKIAVERAVGVNPLNANMLALGAVFLSTAGEYDRASALVQQAIQLKPQHPGWYYFPLFNAAYARGDYEEALRQNKKVNMPRNPMAHLAAAAASGQLGRTAEARAALAALRAIDPALADVDGARAVWTIWSWSEDRIASLVDGFTKAKALDARTEARSDAGREQSIAVLPFADLSEAKDQDWFCDGIAEEILNALARLPGLKVIARTSAFAFKGQDQPVDRIAATLGVTTVLDGSVRRAGSRIRVAARLITAADGSQLWSERYDRELSDVFAVQDDIAAAIAKELRVRLTDAAPAAREHRPAVPAYEAFLMARHQVWRHTPEAYEAGYRSYEQAIALDPGYADPHVGIAELLHIRASFLGQEAQRCAAAIRPALERALALDPLHPEANAWLGIIASTYEYSWREAEERFRIAMASEPVAPYIRHLNAYFRLRFIGRADEAVTEHHRALESDPLNLIMRVGLATSLTCAGRHADAAGEAHRLLQLAPEFSAAYALLPMNVAREPLSVALPYAERLYTRAPWSAGSAGLLAGLLRRAGDVERAATLLRDVEDAEIYGHAVGLALNHLACDEVDQAFGYLTILASQHHPMLMMILIGGPYAEALRASPQWPAFAETVGLAGF